MGRPSESVVHRYKAAYYDEIFREVYKRFGIEIKDAPRHIWVAWHTQVKRMFDKGILIKEIVAAIPEAGEKRKWPIDTGFWKRVEDIVYLHRKEEKKTVKVDTGMTSLKDLLKK